MNFNYYINFIIHQYYNIITFAFILIDVMKSILGLNLSLK